MAEILNTDQTDQIEPQIVCIMCNEYFKNRKILTEHFRNCAKNPRGRLSHSGIKNSFRSSSANDPEKQKVPCDVCDQSFKTISMAIQHKYRKHPNAIAKFYCNYCGMQFPLKVTQDLHVQTSHSAELIQGTYPCPDCGVIFLTQKGQLYHQNSAHNRVTSLVPPIHTPPPSKKIRLNNANEAQSVYYCYLCGFPYINKFNLQRHLEKNHTDLERNTIPEDMLKCTTCDALFYTKQAYESHASDHKPDDLYVTSEEQRLQTIARVDQDFDIRRVQLPTEKFIPSYKPNRKKIKVTEKDGNASDSELSSDSGASTESTDEEPVRTYSKKIVKKRFYAIVGADGTVTKTLNSLPLNGVLTKSSVIKLTESDILQTLNRALNQNKSISVKSNEINESEASVTAIRENRSSCQI